MNPHIIKLLAKGHQEKIKEQDYLAWLFNQYTLSAVSTAIEHNLAGKKAKSKYTKEPIMMSNDFGNEELTEEEIEERELKKMLIAEEQWMKVHKMHGLPETIIK